VLSKWTVKKSCGAFVAAKKEASALTANPSGLVWQFAEWTAQVQTMIVATSFTMLFFIFQNTFCDVLFGALVA
jgi:hypothetical protein